MQSLSVHRLRPRASALGALPAILLSLASPVITAQTVQWGLTVTNINNPIAAQVATNADLSLSITTGGGDTYDFPDSFTYAYQQVDGDFDIRVRIRSLEATDPATQDSPKACLMARANLTPGSANLQISALPLAPSGRDGQIESIARLAQDGPTDDVHGTGDKYGGDTLNSGACTYPDVWLRIRRQGDRFLTYYANTNQSAASPQGTNGWNLLTVVPAGAAFPKSIYVGLATVAHNRDLNAEDRVTATYSDYGPTPTPASTPTFEGIPVPATHRPAALPARVIGVNWNMSVSPDGEGYPGDVLQSDQGSANAIIWNSGGFASIARDVLVEVDSQTAGGFSVARYQCGALDFLIAPRDPVLSLANLGPYSNPNRKRFSQGSPADPPSQAYFPTPEEGFVISTVRKNGAVWNDGSPAFHAATYIQLDGVATGRGYSPINGAFGGGHFYTRMTKLVTGSPTDPASGLDSLQRCAVPLSVAYFPYSQGWKAGYFDAAGAAPNAEPPGKPAFKNPVGSSWIGDGYGAFSGAAVSQGAHPLQPAADLLTWIDTGSGDFSGLAKLTLPGVNSLTDGLLYTVSNDEGGTLRGQTANNAPLADGSGWYVAIRGLEESKSDPTRYSTANSSFSFLYVPFDSANLVGARIRGTDGSTIRGAGNFTMQRLAAGRYALRIPGKTGGNGMLLLQNSGYLTSPPAGQKDVVDTSVLSYEYGGTNSPSDAFVIEARFIDPSVGSDGAAVLRDADFHFVWVDFQTPLAPPGSVTGQPAELGQKVHGFQDDFSGAERNPDWRAFGPGGDRYLQEDGVLKVFPSTGDPNHLLYLGAGASNAVHEVLARIRIVNFGTNDAARAGIGVGVRTNSADLSRGVNLHFRDYLQNGVPGRQWKFLDDQRAWGPAGLRTNVPGQANPGWSDQTWYWLRLRLDPTAGATNVFGKVWIADGLTAEPSDWQMTWADSQSPVRSGYAGITGASIDGLGQSEVDYILIKADTLPEIMVSFPPAGPAPTSPFFTRIARSGTTSAVVEWFGGGSLQAAGNVTGPFTNVSAATPYTVPVNGAASAGPERFHRIAR